MKMQIQLSSALIATSSAFAQPHAQKTSPGWTRPEVMSSKKMPPSARRAAFFLQPQLISGAALPSQRTNCISDAACVFSSRCRTCVRKVLMRKPS